MRLQLTRSALLISLCVSGASAFAVATDSAFSSIPSRFESSQLTASSRGLGELCLSRDVMPDGTPCNPAYLGEMKDSQLLARVFIGNGYTALSTANEFINGTVSKDFLQSIFKENNVSSVELSVGLIFSTQNFSASFSPYRVQHLSEIHNPNLPVLAVHSVLERSFEFEGGANLGGLDRQLKDFSVGAKARILDRKYVHSQFSLLQLSTEDASQLLPVQEQKVFFLDPYVGWHNAKAAWKPRASIAVQNLGYVSDYNPLFPEQADLAAGVGVEPPVPMGTWKIGLDIVNILHEQDDDALSRFRLGTSYRFGILEPMAGVTSKSFTTGFQFDMQVIQAGIIYEFVRSDIETNAFQNRIATEFAVKL